MALLEARRQLQSGEGLRPPASPSAQAVGVEVLEGLTPAQQVDQDRQRRAVPRSWAATQSKIARCAPSPRLIVMIVGLQGAGKTTHTAASSPACSPKPRASGRCWSACDIYRPAAIKQLQVVGAQAGSSRSSPCPRARNPVDHRPKPRWRHASAGTATTWC